MKIEQIYTGCLAQGAYYIVSQGEAAIIDPLREIHPYLERLQQDNVKLKYIFETHFHADFVSGHVDLAKHTGAQIVYGPGATPEFNSYIAKDQEEFRLGELIIKALHTPGHTLESTTYLLKDSTAKDYCIFTGDTLFLGDVGRPDLAQKASNMTLEGLAGLLYDSLMSKIMPLADDLIVYPAHGAGSACGKNMMKETVDTLGNQKKINYALNQPNKQAFITAVTDGLMPPPNYFGMNVAMNKKGYESFEVIRERGLRPLDVDDIESLTKTNNAVIIDTRNSSEFCKAFIPQSFNIGIQGDFAPWAGTVISNINTPIILITEQGMEEEAVTRLARVGFDTQLGYLKGGISSWKKAGKKTNSIRRISADEFEKEFKTNEGLLIDVRKETEFDVGHLQAAQNKPLAYIHHWIQEINSQQHFYLHCQGGYRSMIAASILKAHGYDNFTEIEGGYASLSKTNLSKTDSICQLSK